MRWALALLFLIAAGSSWAMQIDADPRTIISSMDKALLPGLDILPPPFPGMIRWYSRSRPGESG